MTGPEHYREAERLLRVAQTPDATLFDARQQGILAQMAQAHATLALVAATAASRIASPIDAYGNVGATMTDIAGEKEWSEVTG
jgi:hypothetical protein